MKSPEHIEELLKRYASLTFAKPSIQLFHHALVQDPLSFFVDVDDQGLIYFTSVLPHLSATFNVVWWDNKFGPGRRSVCQAVIRSAFEDFDLKRVSALSVPRNVPYKDNLKKMGFTLEGVQRDAVLWEGELEDLIMFGMTRREVSPLWLKVEL